MTIKRTQPLHDLFRFDVQHSGFRVTCSPSPALLRSAFQLRAEVFCRELGWVGTTESELEVDGFDAEVVHLCVEKDSRAVAYLRIHPWWSRWMLRTVFATALPADYAGGGPASCEVSRLAVAPAFRSAVRASVPSPTILLYSYLNAFCALNGYASVEMIVSDRVLRSLRRSGLPCVENSALIRSTDADAPVYASLRWQELTDGGRPSSMYLREACLEAVRRIMRAHTIEARRSVWMETSEEARVG
jgi:N-acyl-L-homoserine lactone synthetase